MNASSFQCTLIVYLLLTFTCYVFDSGRFRIKNELISCRYLSTVHRWLLGASLRVFSFNRCIEEHLLLSRLFTWSFQCFLDCMLFSLLTQGLRRFCFFILLQVGACVRWPIFHCNSHGFCNGNNLLEPVFPNSLSSWLKKELESLLLWRGGQRTPMLPPTSPRTHPPGLTGVMRKAGAPVSTFRILLITLVCCSAFLSGKMTLNLDYNLGTELLTVGCVSSDTACAPARSHVDELHSGAFAVFVGWDFFS